VPELVLLGSQVTVHAPTATGHVAQHRGETGPVPRVHPAVDERVVARVRHGQPVEHEPHVRQAAPGAQRRLVVPQDLRRAHVYIKHYYLNYNEIIRSFIFLYFNIITYTHTHTFLLNTMRARCRTRDSIRADGLSLFVSVFRFGKRIR
jgi:hypothetical protein